MKFIRNQLTIDEIDQLRAAWHASKMAADRYHFSPKSLQTEALAQAANAAEDKLHALWRSHGWEDLPTFGIGVLLSDEGIV